MKLELKEFQKDASDRLVREIHNAAREASAGRRQAVCLASPTGSGKTIVITEVMERLLEGDSVNPPLEDATFLWLSDQPELNRQSRRKVEELSTSFEPEDLVEVDSTFDSSSLEPEKLYFINIQRLGEDKLLIQEGDDRTYTFWETVNRTVDDRGGRCVLIVDEAHRGMNEDAAVQERAATIVQKFIKGAPGEVNPVPLIVGISATPERFQRLIEGTERIWRPVVVSPERVQESGLLKETVTLNHPTKGDQPDITLLRAAAQEWQKYRKRWNDYSAAQLENAISPILVVQVTDGSRGRISNTDISEAVRAVKEEVPALTDRNFAHSFQEGRTLEFDSYSLRYLAPPDIEADPDAAVVFFKTALNTGWDCPRAEVIMSFRRARDATSIAQLVGRMVRMPLARRVETNEVLNTVALYLPYYDEDSLETVISRLTESDPEVLPPTDVERGEDTVTLQRRPESDDLFSVLEELPSYSVPRQQSPSQIHRLLRLSRLLAFDGISSNAPDQARTQLLNHLITLRDEHLVGERNDEGLEEEMKITIRSVNWELRGEQVDEAGETEVAVSSEDLQQMFAWADRRFGGEGLNLGFMRHCVDVEDYQPRQAKMEFVVLSHRESVYEELEEFAQQETQELLREHRGPIDDLRAERRSEYQNVRGLSSEPEIIYLDYPDYVTWKKADETWEKHVYVDDDNMFPASLNTWEQQVLREELERDETVAWLRNPDRKKWALTIPYEHGGEFKRFYPDFLILREQGETLVADLLEPHTADFADAPAKASALARYAGRHGNRFGRIQLIVIDGDRIRRLDLTDERTRSNVRGVSTAEHLRQLFEGL